MNFKKSILMGTISAFLLAGCFGGKDEVEEFNKPALYWYKKIAQSISKGNMDKADEYYISIKSEHIRSPLMPTTMAMLAYAHMNNEEYLLTNYYLDEYNKRYGADITREYTDYIYLKASFLGVTDVNKDQKLIIDTISASKMFMNAYPSSQYLPLVSTMLVRLNMAQYLLNENIAALYSRTGKEEAAKIYRDKNKDSVIELSDITPPEQGIIGMVFD